jgi:hypothetical protein
MSIIQISKVQQRSGDLVDLPQLDEAEFGFASDAKKLFIGKTVGESQNIEVLTAYSEIAFDQIDGAVGNLNINGNTLANGQVLTYDGSNWVNRGGASGGFIDLGSVTDIAISGGEIGYVLTTDSQGGLSWSPKGLIVLDIADISASSEARMTLADPYPLSSGVEITVQSIIPGNASSYANTFNGEIFWLKSVPGNLQLYDIYEDAALNIPVDTTGFGVYPGNGIAIFNTTTANGGLVAGTEYSIQYNNGYDFAGDLGLTWNYTSNTLTVGNSSLGNGNISGHLVVTGTSDLNNVSNVRITGGEPFQFLKTDGNGELYWGNLREDTQGYYLHRQESSSNVWIVQHNLNTQYPDVTPILGSGVAITGRYNYPEVTFINANALSLTFTSATAGYVAVVGDAGDTTAYFLHDQPSASTTWTVDHNLNTRYVAVTPIDSNNKSVIGTYDYPTVDYQTANRVVLTWDTPQTGKVAVVGSTDLTGYYTNSYSVPSNVWVVEHNLNTQYLSVTPVDAAGDSYVGRYDYPNVYYNNANALTLTFSSAVTGNVAVIGSGGFDLPAGGLNTYVQFNDQGSLNGSPAFVFDRTSNTVTISGTLNTTTITTGAAATTGTITGNWSLTPGSVLQSTYADLAEYYAADKQYEPGTVLDFGGDKEVTAASIGSNKIAGVVSSEPSYVMNGAIQAEFPVMIALIGRVPVRVIGKVNKGDMLVSAGNGLAKVCTGTPKIGTVIGKAIENKVDEDKGYVEVMVGRL